MSNIQVYAHGDEEEDGDASIGDDNDHVDTDSVIAENSELNQNNIMSVQHSKFMMHILKV